MAFDLSTARQVDGGFDLSTAKPVEADPAPRMPSGTDLLSSQSLAATGNRVNRAAQLTGRAAVTGAASLPALGADAIGYVLNAGLRALGIDYQFPPQGEALEKNLTAAGLPSPESATERVVYDVNRAVSGQGALAAGGRILAKAAGPVVSRVGEVLATKPALQVTGAGAGAGAGGITRESGGSPTAQLAANVGASIAVPAVAGMVGREQLPAEIKRVMDEAARRKVDLSYSDITGKGRRLDTMLEQAPVVGTSAFRESGAKKATAAMERFAEDVKGTMQATPYRGLDKLKQAAALGDKSAKNTLDQIQNAGDDWTRIMQASGNLKLWRSRQDAEKLYNRVEELARTRGEVPLTKTNSALDAAIAAETKSIIPDKELLDTLNKVKTGLYGTDPTARTRDFTTIRQLRSDIGNLVNSYYQGKNAAVGAKGVDRLQSLKNALEADMEAFATTGGADLKNAWKRADSFYRQLVVPYKDKALAQALKSDLPDEIYKKFIQVSRSGAGEDRAQKFYDALDQKGRAAVRYGMVANAIDSASIPEKQGLLSPGKFEQSIANIRHSSGVFFKGSDKAELDGFANLMEHARRFGQYQENPPTGQRVIPWLALGGAAIRPTEMAAVGSAAYVTRLLLTTETGKDLLISASRLKAGTQQMEKLVQELTRQIPRLAESQSNKETQQQRNQSQ